MWSPALEHGNNKAIQKIKEIASVLSTYKNSRHNIGLLGGNSGIALFHLYYARYSKEIKSEELGFELIENIFNSMNESAPPTLFSSGLAGVGWTIGHLVANNFLEADTDEIFCPVDKVLYKDMIKEIGHKEYDYLHGALGYSVYFLSRKVNKQHEGYLAQLIDRLEKLSISDAPDKIKWVYNYELKENNKTVYNLSLSHGIASIIALLAKMYNKGISQYKAKDMAIKSANFLLSNKLDMKIHHSYFPSWVSQEEVPNSSRMAWCYGDMGIAAALWQAGKIFNIEAWSNEAVEILCHAATRREYNNTYITDTGLCHGSSGVAHIFNRMYNYTGVTEFKEASAFWFEKTLEMASFTDGLAGFKAHRPTENPDYINSPGFLEGIAGIGLSLISAVSDIEPRWDECLLLS